MRLPRRTALSLAIAWALITRYGAAPRPFVGDHDGH